MYPPIINLPIYLSNRFESLVLLYFGPKLVFLIKVSSCEGTYIYIYIYREREREREREIRVLEK